MHTVGVVLVEYDLLFEAIMVLIGIEADDLVEVHLNESSKGCETATQKDKQDASADVSFWQSSEAKGKEHEEDDSKNEEKKVSVDIVGTCVLPPMLFRVVVHRVHEGDGDPELKDKEDQADTLARYKGNHWPDSSHKH